MVNYLHEIPVKSPSVHSSCITSVIAPVCASSQEIPDEFPGTNYGEKNQSEIMAKLHNPNPTE